MNLHTIGLKGGSHGAETDVTLDGERLEGVQEIKIEAGRGKMNVATIRMMATVDVDITGLISKADDVTIRPCMDGTENVEVVVMVGHHEFTTPALEPDEAADVVAEVQGAIEARRKVKD